MQVSEAIPNRRSVKQYEDRPVPREEVERLLDAVRWAPNHRMTEPWRLYVLGPETQGVYAEVRAEMKSDAVSDPDAAEGVRRKVEEESRAIPRMLAVASRIAEDPVIREEDIATVWMGIQNLLLAAWQAGLGGYIRTGPILRDRRILGALEIPEDQRLLAFVQLGYPARVPDPKPRAAVEEKTTWTD